MDNFEEFGNIINDLQLTSKDGNSLKTAVEFFLRHFFKANFEYVQCNEG